MVFFFAKLVARVSPQAQTSTCASKLREKKGSDDDRDGGKVGRRRGKLACDRFPQHRDTPRVRRAGQLSVFIFSRNISGQVVGSEYHKLTTSNVPPSFHTFANP